MGGHSRHRRWGEEGQTRNKTTQASRRVAKTCKSSELVGILHQEEGIRPCCYLPALCRADRVRKKNKESTLLYFERPPSREFLIRKKFSSFFFPLYLFSISSFLSLYIFLFCVLLHKRPTTSFIAKPSIFGVGVKGRVKGEGGGKAKCVHVCLLLEMENAASIFLDVLFWLSTQGLHLLCSCIMQKARLSLPLPEEN